MNDAEAEVQQARVERYVDKWFKTLGLGYWHITHRWHRGPYLAWGDAEVHANTSASASIQWQYLRAVIDWNLVEIKDRPDDILEEDVVHEAMHIFLAEMSKSETDEHEERVATMLARALRWAVELVERQTP